MFASQMIGPVAETARQDRQREYAAERQFAQARMSAHETHSRAGDPWTPATAAWLAGVYLPPVGPVARTPARSRARQERNAIRAGVVGASAAAMWLTRVVGRLSARRARPAAS